MDLIQLSLPAAIAVFAASAGVIAFTGVMMAGTADRLADRTGLGEALTGGVFLGASTSLSGLVVSISTAAQGHAEIALSNAVGGIAVQTLFLAIADITYRRANLEHAAASMTNLVQSALLIVLLSLPLLAVLAPEWTLLGIHPVSFLIVAAYVLGLLLVAQVRKQPTWGPSQTDETKLDRPDEPVGGARTLATLLMRFAVLAVAVGMAGYAIGQTGLAISNRTGLSETIVGALLTAVSTSLPELVTTIAAVRRGALTLAVGGIIGGNTFDVLFVAASDIAYPHGSVFHAASDKPFFVLALSILMTAILLLGLLRRERHGIGNIGFESALLIAVYVTGTALLLVGA